MIDPLPSDALPLLPTKEERTWAMAAHLSGLLAMHVFPIAHILAPLVVWLVKREIGVFMDEQGKEALNAQISFTIYGLIAGALCFVLVGFLLLPVIYVANIVLGILAAIAVNEGRPYRYPFILRLVQ